jgi:hypothetical protein
MMHRDAVTWPVAVIGIASDRVAQDFVGLGEFSKPQRRLGVLWMRVGMSTEGQAAIRTDDLVMGGASTHLEAAVVGAIGTGVGVSNHYLSHLLTDFLRVRYPNT